ncbi:MAG TPA: MBL fold metallo-hydrolase [Candidatus Paceibacterota bacterium]|nr:MBL fold metallo-hydrolase [Candidatus Paceibacterota bacterium]
MVITYYGGAYFKLTLGDLTIATNPPSKESKLKAARFGADIALLSVNHLDYNGVESVTFGEKKPFVIDGPGSYELRDLFFTGAPSTATIDGKTYINTVYGFELDGIKIAFLGLASDEKALSAEAKEIVGTADCLMVAVGDDPTTAYKMAISFDPSIIIPMAYTQETLTRFLKEGGQEKRAPEEKLTLKRRDLDGKEGFISILVAQG